MSDLPIYRNLQTGDGHNSPSCPNADRSFYTYISREHYMRKGSPSWSSNAYITNDLDALVATGWRLRRMGSDFTLLSLHYAI